MENQLGLFPEAMVKQFNDEVDALQIEEREFSEKLMYDFKVVYYEAETGEVLHTIRYSIEASSAHQAYELLDSMYTDEVICDYDDDGMTVECGVSLENVG